MDDLAMDMCNKYSNTDYTVAPSLFLEFHGSEKSVEDQVEKASRNLSPAKGLHKSFYHHSPYFHLVIWTRLRKFLLSWNTCVCHSRYLVSLSSFPHVDEIVSMNEGSNFFWAKEMEERNRLWKARHSMYYAALAYRPGCSVSQAHFLPSTE